MARQTFAEVDCGAAQAAQQVVYAGIPRRRPVPEDGRAIDCKLTPKGFELLPLIVFLQQWAERWILKPQGVRLQVLGIRLSRSHPHMPPSLTFHHTSP
jgi:hypothetical protein